MTHLPQAASPTPGTTGLGWQIKEDKIISAFGIDSVTTHTHPYPLKGTFLEKFAQIRLPLWCTHQGRIGRVCCPPFFLVTGRNKNPQNLSAVPISFQGRGSGFNVKHQQISSALQRKPAVEEKARSWLNSCSKVPHSPSCNLFLYFLLNDLFWHRLFSVITNYILK